MTDRNETPWDEPGATAAPGTEEPPPRPNFVSRLWMVFARPADLFKALAANPAWFPMAVFSGLVIGVSMAVLPAEAFYETATANMQPEQVAEMREVPLALIKWPWVGAVMLLGPVILVFLSLVSYVIFVFMRGDRATFKQHLCVMAHAGIITAVGSLLVAPIRIATLNVQESLALGDLTPFLDGYLYNVLNLLDLFALWATVMAGLGLSVIDPRRRWAPTAAVLLLIFLVLVMVGALFTP